MTDDIVTAAEQILTEGAALADPSVVAWLAEGEGYEVGLAHGRAQGPNLDEPDYSITLTINKFQRHELLNANERIHYRVRASRTEYWRDRTKGEMANAINAGSVRKLKRAHIYTIVTWPDLTKRDVGNWYPTFKACVDGAVDAGLLPGDDDRHLIGPDMRSTPGKGPMSIRLAIFDLGAAL